MIFDLDGVIVDSEPIHMEVMNAVCRQWGEPHTWEAYTAYIGKNDRRIWTEVRERYRVEIAVDTLIKQYTDKLTAYFTSQKEIAIVKDIGNLLKALKAEGITCAIASASSKKNISLVLDHLPEKGAFSVIASGDDVDRGKPAPDIYLYAASLLGVDPGECAAIEDTQKGVQAAVSAGMFCVGFINQTSGDQNLSIADITVSTISELL